MNRVPKFESLSSKTWKVESLRRELVTLLSPLYGDGEAQAMVRLLFHALKGWNQTDLMIHADDEPSLYLISKIEECIKRLLDNEPIQYVLGEARFYGMNLYVDRNVLIPRLETEELVDIVVRENSGSDLRVLDVGTGSGAIAIALSRNLRFPEITVIDISEGALRVARCNARNLNAPIHFIHEDVFKYEPDAGAFDIIVSNPPYIAESEMKAMDANVLDYEPHNALFVPEDNPLVYYSRIAEIGMKSLVAGGKLYFEINPLFAGQLKALLESNGYEDVRILEDISHKKRFAAAVKRQ